MHTLFKPGAAFALLLLAIGCTAAPPQRSTTAFQKPLEPKALTSDQLLAEVNVGHLPARLAIGEGGIWVADGSDSAVHRIDPQTNRLVASIPLGKAPKGLAAGAGAVWVADHAGLSRIDPQTNQVVAAIDVPDLDPGSQAETMPDTYKDLYGGSNANGIDDGRSVAVGAGSVWVTSSSGVVSRVDPGTNQVIAAIEVEGLPAQVAIGNDAVWVANRGNTFVSRIDPQTNQVVERIDVGFSTLALAAGQDSVWVAGEEEPVLMRIDPQTNRIVAWITVGESSWGIAVGADAVWVTSNHVNLLLQIDPRTNRVVAAYKTGLGPLGIGIGEGDLWVVTCFDHTLWRIKPYATESPLVQ
jgi:YVTN family beta-propeller protein